MSTPRPDGPRIEDTVLDHVAHAVPRWQDVWDRYAIDLGAVWNSGGPGPGFAPAQLRFANDARVEVLMPWNVDVNDFLARFLADSGAGPHHLTFKVPDLTSALDSARDFGIEPIGVNRSDPEWQEAFLHPKLASGVVVQLAQQRVAWKSDPPDDYPTLRRQRADGSGPVPPATLVDVCHVVADLDAAVALFGGLLGGRPVATGTEARLRWVDLRWPGPLGLRLVGAVDDDPDGPVHHALAGRPGRVDHLRVTVDEPGAVTGAEPASSPFARLGLDRGAAALEITRSANQGLGIVLLPSSDDLGGMPPGR